MTIKDLAEVRMEVGKANHEDQNWDDLTHQDLMVEAREELADLYNYFSKMPEGSVREVTYWMLQRLWDKTFIY